MKYVYTVKCVSNNIDCVARCNCFDEAIEIIRTLYNIDISQELEYNIKCVKEES